MNEMKSQGRRNDIDRLRVYAMLTVFLLHSTCPFHLLTWHVKNDERSMGFSVLLGFLDSWQMPFFFLIAGAGSFYALKNRSGSQYIWDRFKRLVVPYWGIGLLLFVVPQYFLQEVHRGNFDGAIWEFYPVFFREFHGSGFFSLSFKNSHLWFLYSLFFMSVVLVPVMGFFKGDTGKKLIDKLASLCTKRGGIFLLIVPLYLYKMALGIGINSLFNWPEQFHYMFYFLFGYMVVSHPGFVESLKRDWWIGLIICIVCYVAESVAIVPSKELQDMIASRNFSLPGLAFMSLMTTGVCWGLIVALLGLGAMYLNRDSTPALAYSNEAVLPFYVVHQTFITVTAFYAVKTDLPLSAKFGIVLVTAFVLSIGTHELLIRRFNPMRLLFGMKLKNKPETALEETKGN